MPYYLITPEVLKLFHIDYEGVYCAKCHLLLPHREVFKILTKNFDESAVEIMQNIEHLIEFEVAWILTNMQETGYEAHYYNDLNHYLEMRKENQKLVEFVACEDHVIPEGFVKKFRL